MKKILIDLPLDDLEILDSHIKNVFKLPLKNNLMEIEEFRIFMEQLNNCIKRKKDKI